MTSVISDVPHTNLEHLEIPAARAKRITFEYKGITFTTQYDNILYIHKLEGWEEEWSAATNQRSVDYANLKPGTYTFMVKAINRDLVYSEVPATVTLTIRPPFYMTAAFLVPASIVGLGIALAFYLLTTRLILTRRALKREQEAEHQRIIQEMQNARQMQMRLLPEAAPQVEGFDIAGVS